jgi:endonuclease-8
MPEGDALHRAAARLQALVEEQVEAVAPHPRGAATGVAAAVDGRRLESVEAVGKNLLLRFEGGVTVRSHLRMSGRWRVQAAGEEPFGTPWLVLRGSERQAVLWNGPVLELTRGRSPAVARLGPDVLADPPDEQAMVARLRAAGSSRQIGDALLDQRLLSGIGNMWKAEILFEAEISPWRPIGELSERELERIVGEATRLMRGGRRSHRVYRRAGRPCPRCGAAIRSYPQGDEARMAYWCPGCQAGTGRLKA